MKQVLLFAAIFFGGYDAGRYNAFPEAGISNGLVKAALYLPDARSGYYQATRFDWSGVIKTLEYKGHSYFGQWFKKYDPKLHDAILGPVQEFQPIGYDEAMPGGTFLKIGVGALRKSSDKPYSSFTLYDIANAGTWKVQPGKDRVTFTHELKDDSGYAYLYSKTVRLVAGKAELLLEHRLKNTGKRLIETNAYDHNFFVIDNERTGPSIKITFPFAPAASGRGLGEFAAIKGNEINYQRGLNEEESLFLGDIKGYGKDASDYDFKIENLKTKAGVRIRSDQLLEKMVFWASPTTSCPEPYIHIKAAPGAEFSWKIHYEFYEIP